MKRVSRFYYYIRCFHENKVKFRACNKEENTMYLYLQIWWATVLSSLRTLRHNTCILITLQEIVHECSQQWQYTAAYAEPILGFCQRIEIANERDWPYVRALFVTIYSLFLCFMWRGLYPLIRLTLVISNSSWSEFFHAVDWDNRSGVVKKNESVFSLVHFDLSSRVWDKESQIYVDSEGLGQPVLKNKNKVQLLTTYTLWNAQNWLVVRWLLR